MPQIPCEAVIIIDQNEQDSAFLPAGWVREALYYFLFIILLQAFARAAKLAIVSIKAARRTQTTCRRGNTMGEECKTQKNNEKICGKMIPHK